MLKVKTFWKPDGTTRENGLRQPEGFYYLKKAVKMASVNGTEFQKGETYKGVIMHVDDNKLYELNLVEVSGQYPDPRQTGEAWMLNEESSLTIRRFKGMGFVAMRDMLDGKPAYEYTPLGTEDTTQHTVSIPAGTWYSLESIGEDPLVARVTYTPALDQTKQRIASERELVWEQS